MCGATESSDKIVDYPRKVKKEQGNCSVTDAPIENPPRHNYLLHEQEQSICFYIYDQGQIFDRRHNKTPFSSFLSSEGDNFLTGVLLFALGDRGWPKVQQVKTTDNLGKCYFYNTVFNSSKFQNNYPLLTWLSRSHT